MKFPHNLKVLARVEDCLREYYFQATFTLVAFIIEREDGIISLSVYFRLSWCSLWEEKKKNGPQARGADRQSIMWQLMS